MQRYREQNIKLNKDKVKLQGEEVNNGLKTDPAKIKAVLKMPTPTDVASVHRSIRFTNYLSKFLPCLSDARETLQKLMLPDIGWFWTNLHDGAVQQVKQLVTNVPVLKYFDSTKGVTLQCAVSDKELGQVMSQDGLFIMYSSLLLMDPDTGYATATCKGDKELWNWITNH